MIIGIHQLHYIPWLRYFHKISNCDLFVILDDIQYNKNGWQNRNKIKGPNGELILTIPVFGKFQQRLDEVSIDNKVNWKKKHWNSIINSYSKAPHFSKYRDSFGSFYETDWNKLNDINLAMLKHILDLLNIKTKIAKSSEIHPGGSATERLINICRQSGADTYYTGEYATEVYLDKDAFQKEGIEIKMQDWTAPVYDQLFPEKGFIKDLSILDLLFNEGDKSTEIILNKQ